MNKFKILFLIFILTNSSMLFSQQVTPVDLQLSSNEGGYVSGKTFSNRDLKGKITAIFYVDPDHRTINDEANQKLQAESFNLKFYQSFAIINMAATWLPNAILDSALKKSQKEFPSTHYVKDLNKSVVNKWKLADDNYQTILLNELGVVLFNHVGVLDQMRTNELIQLIKKEISRLEKYKL